MQLTYERVTPHATYAPWLADPEFLSIHQATADHTMVDHYRQFELWQLVDQAVKLPGDFLEVGVWRGGTGCLMAKRAKILGSDARIYLCDTFAGVVKAGEHDSVYRGGEHADTSSEIAQSLADSLSLDNVSLLTGIFPDDTGHLIADRRFSLCHIDVDVHDSALSVLEWVWPRMPVGGVVVYDDYGFETCSGITRLVDTHRKSSDAITLHNLNGHAVVIKIA